MTRQISYLPREPPAGPGLRLAIDFHNLDEDPEGRASLMYFNCSNLRTRNKRIVRLFIFSSCNLSTPWPQTHLHKWRRRAARQGYHDQG
ncbi:hypothetical protein CEP54_014591 [Fusarium duplospermum]|uniref:Uncharacterized protein n=1 Tax=Fusarium duplospermum TaxID=1325734 RepID=A0A428NV73_9HYPO|nr:hypothetical protein CEP54_014591 [Fusarium duplospermum]